MCEQAHVMEISHGDRCETTPSSSSPPTQKKSLNGSCARNQRLPLVSRSSNYHHSSPYNFRGTLDAALVRIP